MRSCRGSSSGRAEACRTNPRAWLVSTGRFKAIDRLRRRARFDVALEESPADVEALTDEFRRRMSASASRTIACG